MYENEWLGYITNESKNEHNAKLNMLKFPINLLLKKKIEIIQLKDIQLLKMNDNIDNVAIYKYYDMIQNKRITTNAKFELVSPNEIIIHHGNFSWFNNFQFKSFDVWKMIICQIK